MINPIKRVIAEGKITPDDLDRIFLVGGTTRMPMIKSLIVKLFGKLPMMQIDPDHIVALGAAVQGELISNNKSFDEVVLTDVCPYTLGIAVTETDINQNPIGECFLPIIERNQIIPTSRVE